MDIILKREENLDLCITTYNILPINNKEGFIEMISSSKTLYQLQKDSFTIQNFINENNPDSSESFLYYMEREQYGSWSILDRKSTLQRQENMNWKRYTNDRDNPSGSEVLSFVWNYQIKEMYLRYFAWQFIVDIKSKQLQTNCVYLQPFFQGSQMAIKLFKSTAKFFCILKLINKVLVYLVRFR